MSGRYAVYKFVKTKSAKGHEVNGDSVYGLFSTRKEAQDFIDNFNKQEEKVITAKSGKSKKRLKSDNGIEILEQ